MPLGGAGPRPALLAGAASDGDDPAGGAQDGGVGFDGLRCGDLGGGFRHGSGCGGLRCGGRGGRFACGGGRPDDRDTGYFISPTVIAGLDNSARVAREEIFGPVLTVIAHDGDDDAINIANDSPYGLSGSVFSSDPERAQGVADRLRVGTVNVNGGVWYSADVPFGGYKQSGVGREMGLAGFEEYLELKVIATAV